MGTRCFFDGGPGLGVGSWIDRGGGVTELVVGTVEDGFEEFTENDW